MCEHLGGFQQRLEEESPGKEELNSCPQTAVFPIAVAEWRKDQRFILARERLSVTEFPSAVAKLEADHWSTRQPFLWLPALSSIQMYRLSVRLSWRGCAIDDNYMYPEWSHNVHTSEAGR